LNTDYKTMRVKFRAMDEDVDVRVILLIEHSDR
jgi:hypothetical protein